MRTSIGLVVVVLVLSAVLPAQAQQLNLSSTSMVPNSGQMLPQPTTPQTGTFSKFLGTSGLWHFLPNFSFFLPRDNGITTTIPPDPGLSYLQSFGYRVAQPAK